MAALAQRCDREHCLVLLQAANFPALMPQRRSRIAAGAVAVAAAAGIIDAVAAAAAVIAAGNNAQHKRRKSALAHLTRVNIPAGPVAAVAVQPLIIAIVGIGVGRATPAEGR